MTKISKNNICMSKKEALGKIKAKLERLAKLEL
jgi:hypothetical protein